MQIVPKIQMKLSAAIEIAYELFLNLHKALITPRQHTKHFGGNFLSNHYQLKYWMVAVLNNNKYISINYNWH
jgi:hypothetical protein